MRKQEQDSWIIYILLIEYVVSINTCERGTSLGELKFGYFLPRSAFTTKYQVSSYQCAIECHLRIHRCKSFNYRRSDLSCQLCEEDSGPGGNNLQPKAGSIHSDIDTWRNLPIEHCNTIHCLRTEKCDSSKQAGENTCVPAECPFAELKLGMTIKPSNETAVGTKARRRSPSNSCDMGYMNVSLKGSNFCFKAYSIVKTFNQAMEICESEKAKLAVITTEDQISDLRPHLPVGWIYVGISDGTKEGTWEGWDGKAVNLTWSPFEPNGGINENCGVINPYGIGVYDASCAWNLYFLCSKF
ncbi:hypothetical protein ACJMK2_001902 [Sinanodonta woodiana]|uniref:C-type lectin domain-containing protein n=1 Tax=Sinanodonta woodiana TaxID=1069815 RepID=A0ABD3XTN0_SINWO